MQFRLARGLKRPHLARLAGLNTETVARLERRENVPTRETAAALAQVLGVPTESLFVQTYNPRTRNGEPQPAAAASAGVVAPTNGRP